MKRTLVGVAVVAALGGATNACAPVEQDATDRDKPVKNANYSSVDDLIDAAIKAGYDCPKRHTEYLGLSGEKTGSCSGDDGFYLLTASGLNGVDPAKEWRKKLTKSSLETHTYLQGPDWVIVNTRPAKLKKVRPVLGGTLLGRGAPKNR